MSMHASTTNDAINYANHSNEITNPNVPKTNGKVDNESNRNTIDKDETVSDCNSDVDSACRTTKQLSEENKCTNSDQRGDNIDNSSTNESAVCGEISKSTHKN